MATFQFTGMPWHGPSGLYLPTFRGGYDTNLGRFIQRDQMGEAGGFNLYGYCGDNPVDYLDPDGLCKTLTVEFSISAGVDKAKAIAQALASIEVLKQLLAKCTCKGYTCIDVKVIFDLAAGGNGFPPNGPNSNVEIEPYDGDGLTPNGQLRTKLAPLRPGITTGSLSHELGHQGGYQSANPAQQIDPNTHKPKIGPDGNPLPDDAHNADPSQIMYPYDKGGRNVDDGWCQALQRISH